MELCFKLTMILFVHFICFVTLLFEANSLEFSLPDDYNANEAPRGEKGPVEVSLSLEILKLLEMDSENNIFALDLWFYMRWIENRIIINKSSAISPSVTLDAHHKDTFWKPRFYEWFMRELVIRKGINELIRISVSKEKIVLLATGITLRTMCNFDFSMFPFDVQCCALDLLSYPDTSEKVVMKWHNGNESVFFNNKKKELKTPRYILTVKPVEKARIIAGNSANFSSLTLYISMRRQTMSHILEVYLPSTLFVVVSWLSFLISPEIVPGRMVLLVTNLLTLVTIFEAKSSTSPPSLSVQAMNVWMLSTIVLVFCALLEYAFVLVYNMEQQRTTNEFSADDTKLLLYPRRIYPERFACNEKKQTKMSKPPRKKKCRCSSCCGCTSFLNKKGNSIDRMSIIIFPLLFILYNLGYWLLYIEIFTEDENKIHNKCDDR